MTRLLRPVFSIIILMLLSQPVTSPGERPPTGRGVASDACEPTGLVDLQARVVSLVTHRGRIVATIDLELESHVTLAGARLSGRRQRRGGGPLDLGVNEEIGPTRARIPRARRLVIELEQGVENHVYLTLKADTGHDEVSATTHLVVDLDPSRAPERVDDVVQYRARMEGP